LARILAIDYGTKRCGFAVTDELQIIANPLETVQTLKLFEFLDAYLNTNKVVKIVVGKPIRLSGKPSNVESEIVGFIRKFKKHYPEIEVVRENEQFTSKLAFNSLLEAGAKKSIRKQKEIVDKISATLILQSFLNQ